MPGEQPCPANGAGSSMPQCMSGFVDKDYLYGIHIHLNGDAEAFKWHEPTDTYTSIDLETVASNHLELPMMDITDDHFTLAVGVDDQDSVFIVGNHHDNQNGPLTSHMVVCTAVDEFADPLSWSGASTTHYDSLNGTASDGVYTYHHFERLSNGTLLHFLSQSEVPTDSRGRDYLGFKRVAGTWSPIVSDGHFATTAGVDDGVTANRVYVNRVVVDNNDRVHVTGIWRYDDENPASSNSPWYIYSDNLSTWKFKDTLTDGTQTMPITWANRTGADIGATGATHAAAASLFVDPDTGYPAIYVRDLAGSIYEWYFWNGSAWDKTSVAAQSGNYMDICLMGERWRRLHTSGRLQIRRESDGKFVAIGTGIVTAAENFDAMHDPVWLRERDLYTVVVGDGNTPKVWTFGPRR